MTKNPWRKDFPQLNQKNVYLDTAATSLTPKSVINSVKYYYEDLSANIHRGMYEAAIITTKLYEETRETVADFINANVDEVIYTRGTTSGLNLVAFGYGLKHLKPGDEIVTSELEHHSSFLPWQMVAEKTGAILKYVPLNEAGRITLDAYKSALSDKTKIVALTYVSNVMGYISPMKEIIRLAHEVEALVVVDAAQAVQHLTIDVKTLDCDFLAFSGHKMLGPTGIGILYAKSQLQDLMSPTEYGGDMNDDVNKDQSTWKMGPQKFEAGTMPIASVIGLKTAVDYIRQIGVEQIASHIDELYQYAMTKLKNIEGLTLYNPSSDTGIIAFNLDNVPSHDAISYFAEKGIAIRAGQHCAKLICDWLRIHACLRASLFLYNDFDDVDRLVEVAKEAIQYFRHLGF